MASDVLGLFQELDAPLGQDPNSFNAVRLPSAASIRVAKSGGGHPALLLPASGQQHAPISLRNLRVLFNVPCRTDTGGVRADETLIVVECFSPDADVRVLFLRAISHVLAGLEDQFESAVVSHVIQALVELFTQLSRPKSRSVQGVWGELYMLARCHEPQIVASHWHAQPDDRFDFGTGGLMVEVKTSIHDRVHEFSLDQLIPTHGRIVIASLITHRVGGGLSVADLVDEVQGRLFGHPDTQLRVLQTVIGVLGADWLSTQEIRFDAQAAGRSLRFFESASVPRIPLPLPAGVSGVRFKAQLDPESAIRPRSVGNSDELWPYLPSEEMTRP